MTWSSFTGRPPDIMSNHANLSCGRPRPLLWAALMLLPALAATRPASAASADDWPSFRGNAGLTGVAAQPLPADLAVRWTYESAEGIESTAALVDGVVYVGSLDGKLHALDFDSGKVLWTYEAGDEIKSSPGVRKGVVYFGDESGRFHAVDAAGGRAKWTFAADGGVIASASFAGGHVIFGSQDNFLYALNPDSGALVWKVETGSYIYGTAAVARLGERQVVLVAGCDGVLRGLDPRDGSEVVQVGIDAYVGGSTAVGGRLAYVGTFENQVLGIDLVTRKVAWTYENPQHPFPFYSSAALSAERVVIGGRDKLVHALNPETGHAVWTYAAGARVDSSPVIAGSTVYFGTLGGDLVGLDLESGKKVWEFATGSSVTASPAVAGGRMVIGTLDGMLYCFAAAGKEKND
jgi:outer membrane protein assembly factor BamB